MIIRLARQWYNFRGAGKWSGRAVARRLGVSHTYVQKLVKRFMKEAGREGGGRGRETPGKQTSGKHGLSFSGPRRRPKRGAMPAGISASGQLQELGRENPATFEQLGQAQERTRQERGRGELRPLWFWKKGEWKIGENVIKDWMRIRYRTPLETSKNP